jgi:hypothetical protein
MAMHVQCQTDIKKTYLKPRDGGILPSYLTP